MYCVICGYDIRHARDARCPECGSSFDPADETTYAESPIPVLRWLQRIPALRRWLDERLSTVNCRCCGTVLTGREVGHCPSCETRYDPQDLGSVLHTWSLVPTVLLRIRHACFWRGLLAPFLLTVYGIWCIATQRAFLPGAGRGFGSQMMDLTGAGAVAMGIAWLGAAGALHAAYFWGRIEPCWRWAPLGKWASLAIMFGGWGYAFVQAWAEVTR